MMFYITVSTVFLIEILTTRSLNRGRLKSGLWRLVWTIELTFLGLMLFSMLLGFTAFARWAMVAAAAIFLLRAGVRGFDHGFVKIVKETLPVLRTGATELGSAIWEITTLNVGLFATIAVALIKALPEAMVDEVGSNKESEHSMSFTMGSRGGYNYSTGEYDYEPGIRFSTDEEL